MHLRPSPAVGAMRRNLYSGSDIVLKWKSPRVVEIACGGEINAYFPAEL